MTGPTDGGPHILKAHDEKSGLIFVPTHTGFGVHTRPNGEVFHVVAFYIPDYSEPFTVAIGGAVDLATTVAVLIEQGKNRHGEAAFQALLDQAVMESRNAPTEH